MPTLPLFNTVIKLVLAEFVSSNIEVAPVPAPHTDSLLYGVVVPMPTLPLVKIVKASTAATLPLTARLRIPPAVIPPSVEAHGPLARSAFREPIYKLPTPDDVVLI